MNIKDAFMLRRPLSDNPWCCETPALEIDRTLEQEDGRHVAICLCPSCRAVWMVSHKADQEGWFPPWVEGERATSVAVAVRLDDTIAAEVAEGVGSNWASIRLLAAPPRVLWHGRLGPSLEALPRTIAEIGPSDFHVELAPSNRWLQAGAGHGTITLGQLSVLDYLPDCFEERYWRTYFVEYDAPGAELPTGHVRRARVVVTQEDVFREHRWGQVFDFLNMWPAIEDRVEKQFPEHYSLVRPQKDAPTVEFHEPDEEGELLVDVAIPYEVTDQMLNETDRWPVRCWFQLSLADGVILSRWVDGSEW